MPTFLILSFNASGGIAKYQAEQIQDLIKNQVRVFLLDAEPALSLAKLNSSLRKYLNVVVCPVWDKPKLVFQEISKIVFENDNITIAISNPSLLIKYFFFFKNIRKRANVNLQLTLHSRMIFNKPIPSFFGEALISLLSYLVMDRIIFVSNYTRKYWQSRHILISKCTSSVIPNSVAPILGLPAKKVKGTLRVGFVGRLSKDKDPMLFCKIAKYSKQQDENLEFHIFGDGPLEARLREKFSSCVVFHGWQEEISLYDKFDVLLITSPVENCPYTLLESKSRGIPVIAKKVGGIPEIVQDGVDGILLISFEMNHFINSIKSIEKRYEFFSYQCLQGMNYYQFNTAIK